MSTQTGCLIVQDTRQVQGHSSDLSKSLRKLRRDLQKCKDCESVEGCQVLKEFNTLVQSSIDTVLEEWNLTSLTIIDS